jgi:hypothetical protein
MYTWLASIKAAAGLAAASKYVSGGLDFAERDECKPVLLGLSLAGNVVKPLLSLYGTEWRERGYELWRLCILD